jgi:hypothetical protein
MSSNLSAILKEEVAMPTKTVMDKSTHFSQINGSQDQNSDVEKVEEMKGHIFFSVISS